MGTRGLICINKGKDNLFAIDKSSDAYPQELGIRILRWIKERLDLDKLTQVLSDSTNQFGSDSPTILAYKYPEIADMLNDVQNYQGTFYNELENYYFAASFQCQWAYVIDLETKTFEVYQGGNTKTLAEDERFKFLEEDAIRMNKTARHQMKPTPLPCKLLKKYSLDQLPDEDKLLKDCKCEGLV